VAGYENAPLRNNRINKTGLVMDQCFVVGVGRSGTTLVSAFMGAHSKLQAQPETGILRRYIFSKVDTSVKDALKDERVARNEQLVDILRQSNSIEDAYSQMMSADLEGISFQVDKDPRLIEYIVPTAEMFPEAKFVHVLRDPRDVLASKLKADWSRGRTLFSYLLVSRIQLMIARQAEIAMPHRVHLLRYEYLIRNPKDQCKSLCRFLGIDFEDAMLDHSRSSNVLVHESEMQWKGNIKLPLMRNNAGKWKSELTDLQRRSAINVVKDIGYSFDLDDKQDISILTDILAKILGLGVRFSAQIYILMRVKR
jgi:Sulfotransferase family